MNAPQTLDKRTAGRIFWAVMLVFNFFVVLFSAVFQPTLRLDNLHQLGIGQEWVFGCYMFPGLSTWFAHITWLLTGGAEFAPFLTSAIFTTVTFWAIWQLGREYLSEAKALMGSLVMLAYWYFNVGSAVYSNYVPMATFWLLAVLMFHRALAGNLARHWILTGVFLGLGLWCKYPAMVLVISILVFMFAHPDARRHWRHAGPYLSILAAVLVFLPHTIYLLTHFQQMHAYIARKSTDGGFFTHFLPMMLNGWGQQLGVILPVMLALTPILGFRPKFQEHPKTGSFRDAFIPAMFFLPLAVQTAVQFASGVAFPLRAYGYQLWVLLGLFLLYTFQASPSPRAWLRSRQIVFTVSVIMLFSLPVLFVRTCYFSDKPSVRFFPAEELAAEVNETWDKHMGDHPLPTISSDDESLLVWQAGVYHEDRPEVNAPSLGTWCSDEEAAGRGGVVLWEYRAEYAPDEVPPHIRERFPQAVFAETVEVRHYQRSPNIRPLKIGLALLYPPENEHRHAVSVANFP